MDQQRPPAGDTVQAPPEGDPHSPVRGIGQRSGHPYPGSRPVGPPQSPDRAPGSAHRPVNQANTYRPAVPAAAPTPAFRPTVVDAPAPTIGAAIAPLPHGVLLSLAGELDHDGAARLRPLLDDARLLAARRIVVDCSELAFFDSGGLRLLLQARRDALARGAAVELAAPGPVMELTLRLTGTWDLFRVHPSVAQARSAPASG